jgi:hypothetical protein
LPMLKYCWADSIAFCCDGVRLDVVGGAVGASVVTGASVVVGGAVVGVAVGAGAEALVVGTAVVGDVDWLVAARVPFLDDVPCVATEMIRRRPMPPAAHQRFFWYHCRFGLSAWRSAGALSTVAFSSILIPPSPGLADR